VSDNGTQFASQQLGKLCTELGIKLVFTSVEHPQMNGWVESANRVLLRGMKRRLDKPKGPGQKKFIELCGLTTLLPSPQREKHPLAWCMVRTL